MPGKKIWIVYQEIEDEFGRDHSLLLGVYSTRAIARNSKAELKRLLGAQAIEGRLSVHYTTLDYRGWEGGYFTVFYGAPA